MIGEQIKFARKYREVIMKGDFYRLMNPYAKEAAAWMVVSKDQHTALVGYYKMVNQVNTGFIRLKLRGLNEEVCYQINGKDGFYGNELMYAGMVVSHDDLNRNGSDYASIIYEITSNSR